MRIRGDRYRVGQIVMNFLTNAIKHTPVGKIVLTVEVEKEGVTVTVADTGSGISKEVMANIFQDFRKFGTRPGTGLGLSLCKKISTAA